MYLNLCPTYLTLKRARYTSLTDDRKLREEERKKGRKGGGQEAAKERQKYAGNSREPTDNQNEAER